jgi:hypothetical protein
MPREVDMIFVGRPLNPKGGGLGPLNKTTMTTKTSKTFKIFWIANDESKKATITTK